MKKCSKCGIEKELNQFHKHPQSKDGRRPDCKICFEAVHKKYRTRPEVKKRISDYMKNYDYSPTEEQKKKWRDTTAARHIDSPRHALSVSRLNALARAPIDNFISLEELMGLWKSQNGMCALSGIKMTWRGGKILPTSISMDRIVPSKGYASGNIRLLCFCINVFRGQMSDQDMLNMAKRLVNHMDQEKMHWIESNDDDRAWVH